jgi:hypothetical protein
MTESHDLAFADGWNAAIEECAKMVEPKKPRPCDCERCHCHNTGDAEAVAAWDADSAMAKAIRLIARPASRTPAAAEPVEGSQGSVVAGWLPITSLSTEDMKDVELRMPGGNVEVGHFCPVQRQWKIRNGNYLREHEQQPGVIVNTKMYRLLKGLYPERWRSLTAARGNS